MGPALVRGLVATSSAPKGSTLLSVPLSHTLQDAAVPEAYPGAPWAASVAAYLITQCDAGSESEWAPYVASLPGDLCSSSGGGGGQFAGMLSLRDDQLCQVQYGPAIAALEAFRRQARQAYDDWRKAGSGPALGCSWDRFCLALHLVQSRTIRLAIMGCRVMIPGVDCLNHGGSSGACGTLALGASSWSLEGERTVNFVTTRDVAAGEQVLWTYGDRSSEDFFVYHGFVLPDNPQEEVQLWGGLGELVSWFRGLGYPAVARLEAEGRGAGLARAAEAAAERAVQVAAIACPSPHVPGTCSFLMVPLQLPTRQLQRSFQHQGAQQPAAGGNNSSGRSSSGSGSNGSGGGGTSRGGGMTTGGSEALESWLTAVKLSGGSAVARRLASLRLHLPEWGTDACRPTPSELVARADGHCDARMAAALIALSEAVAGALGSAMTVAVQQGPVGAPLSPAALVRLRAAELLAVFPTTTDEDERLLSSGGEVSDGLMREVVAYRVAKKRALRALAALGTAAASGSPGAAAAV